MDFALTFFYEVWRLTLEMAPYLLLGFAAAGFLHVLLPLGFVAKHLGGESSASVFKSTFLGMPLPVCSCGVLPIATSLRKSGAGKGPSLSFLISTPVTGVDSILATAALLGYPFMLVRLAASCLIGFFTGLAGSIFSQENNAHHQSELNAQTKAPSAKLNAAAPGSEPSASMAHKFKNAMAYGFIELPATMANSMLIGLLFAGLIATLISPEWIEAYLGTGFLGLLVSVLIAIPLYVCATGSIPIAASMLGLGFTPGAALAFLIAGPATNAVAISTVLKTLGKRHLFIYLAGIFIGALGLGALLDMTAFTVDLAILNKSAEHYRHTSYLKSISAIILVALFVLHYAKSMLSRINVRQKGVETNMDNAITLHVPDMSCQHCKATISNSLQVLPEVEDYHVDLAKRRVVVGLAQGQKLSSVLEKLQDVGYGADVIDNEQSKHGQ